MPLSQFCLRSPSEFWIAGIRYASVHEYLEVQLGNTSSGFAKISVSGEGSSTVERTPNPWVVSAYWANLMKFRQNPRLANVLSMTRSARLYYESSDDFWGIGSGDGLNWLGKILESIRGQLNSLSMSDVSSISDLCLDKRLLRYIFSIAYQQERHGGDAWLFHLIRERAGHHSLDSLRSILTSNRVEATIQLNGAYACCFSLLSLIEVQKRVYGAEATLRRYSEANVYAPYGIAVRLDYARELGFRQVLPMSAAEENLLPSYMKYLVQAYSSESTLDYTHETEWRFHSHFYLDGGPCSVVLPGDSKNLQMLSLWEYTTPEIMRLIR